MCAAHISSAFNDKGKIFRSYKEGEQLVENDALCCG